MPVTEEEREREGERDGDTQRGEGKRERERDVPDSWTHLNLFLMCAVIWKDFCVRLH